MCTGALGRVCTGAVGCLQERAEAKALFRKGEAKKRGDTFVPGEALEGQTAGGEKKEGDEQEREGEAREAAAEEERKTGPTPEQLTAIKVCCLPCCTVTGTNAR